MPRRQRTVPWLDTRDGIYYAFWYNAAKRCTERFSLRTEDPLEATHRFAAFLTQGKDLYAGGAEHIRLTCGAAFDFYVAEHVDKKVVDGQRQKDAIANLRLFFNDVA